MGGGIRLKKGFSGFRSLINNGINNRNEIETNSKQFAFLKITGGF